MSLDRGEAAFIQRLRTAILETTTAVVSSALWFLQKSGGSLASSDTVVLETLRLVPPAWLIPRRLSADHVGLVDEELIGQEVFISPLIIHYRSSTFADPAEFNPGNWVLTNRRSWPSDYCPFGFGRSGCWFWREVLLIASTMVEFLRHNSSVMLPRFKSAVIPVSPVLAVAGVRFLGASA
ncbi:cytochrome P450 [Pseudarthrobacter sp. J1738]